MPGSVIRDLLAAARQMDETMVSAFTAACSFRRLDLALVNPGTIQTVLVDDITAAGGTAEEWSDGDLTTMRGAQKLRDWIVTKSPRLVWFCCPAENSTLSENCRSTAVQSPSRHQSREHRIQRHLSKLATDMASSGQCDFVLEIPWNSRAVRFGGCIHDNLKGFHCAWVPACAWGLRTGSSGYSEGGWRVVTSMRSIADLHISRSCNETHWHRLVESTFPPAASLSQLCRRLQPIILRRSAPMELAELVAGATIKRRRLRGKQTVLPDKEEGPIPSNLEEHPVETERKEPWRPLTENEKFAWNALSSAEKKVCDALVHRLHRELGHSDIRGMVDSLRQNHAHPTVLAAAKLMQCTACQESARMLSRPVTSGKVMEPGAVLQMDNFYWKHPTKEVHVRGTLLVDASSRAAVIRIWKTAPRQELLGNVSSLEARQMLQESWLKFYGRPETVMTDPEGCFRDRLFREWLSSENVKWDPQPAEAAWRIGILDKVLDVLKNAATRAARRAPEDTSCEALFDDCTEAHNELHRRRGYSPFQLLIGRSPPGLPLDGDKQLGELSASLTSDGRHRLHIQRECYRAYLDEEMSLQQKRREMHKSRPFRVWSSGEWCWVLTFESTFTSTNQGQSSVQRGCVLGTGASSLART